MTQTPQAVDLSNAFNVETAIRPATLFPANAQAFAQLATAAEQDPTQWEKFWGTEAEREALSVWEPVWSTRLDFLDAYLNTEDAGIGLTDRQAHVAAALTVQNVILNLVDNVEVEGGRVLDLIRAAAPSADQITTMLSLPEVMLALVEEDGVEKGRPLDLIASKCTVDQITQILSAPEVMGGLAWRDLGEYALGMIAGYTPDQITQILSAPGAMSALAGNDLGERAKKMLAEAQAAMAARGNTPPAPSTGGAAAAPAP